VRLEAEKAIIEKCACATRDPSSVPVRLWLLAQVKAKMAPTLKEGAAVEASMSKARRELEDALQAETFAK